MNVQLSPLKAGRVAGLGKLCMFDPYCILSLVSSTMKPLVLHFCTCLIGLCERETSQNRDSFYFKTNSVLATFNLRLFTFQPYTEEEDNLLHTMFLRTI